MVRPLVGGSGYWRALVDDHWRHIRPPFGINKQPKLMLNRLRHVAQVCAIDVGVQDVSRHWIALTKRTAEE